MYFAGFGITDINVLKQLEKSRRDEVIKALKALNGDHLSFAAKIYDEARRMAALVEDIIRLSQLDERDVPCATGEIDLLEMAKKIGSRLSSLANLKGVALSVSGQDGSIQGVSQLIEELIANLIENAIKYSNCRMEK